MGEKILIELGELGAMESQPGLRRDNNPTKGRPQEEPSACWEKALLTECRKRMKAEESLKITQEGKCL